VLRRRRIRGPGSGSSSSGVGGSGGRHELPGLESGLDGFLEVVPLAGSVLECVSFYYYWDFEVVMPI